MSQRTAGALCILMAATAARSDAQQTDPFIWLEDVESARGHARKMAARMESMGLPFYYFENTEGGHGSGVTSEQRAKMTALTYVYLWEMPGAGLGT